MPTDEMTDLGTEILKNVNTHSVTEGLAVAQVIAAAFERRDDLRGHMVSAQWDRERGIGILVDDAGHRDHLANILWRGGARLPLQQYRVPGIGTGYGRQKGVAGFLTTIWTIET